ncbi:biotin/lipoate--protein ligase family protein [Azospirillum isscasi]|uniref:Biotin/lipoate--protein ligase family protein n=1 Tax=Azospirillum isscasi TaxID=3053926 RepID=A0ABU0WMZ4_9PROT|nr:biotin/lipoate--protein ligase family protein [Azospirillum isscasi]MDQ2105603.1 biotin/lipoate--protein ligase family protein [Azospirillum isscasi]
MDPTGTPTLPPIFRPWPAEADGPFATACRFAAEGAEPGTLVHAGRRDRLDVAVVLAPDRPGADGGLAAVTLVALADALEALGPPNQTIRFDGTGRLMLNGAAAGVVTVVLGPDEEDGIPAWAVAAAELEILGDPDDPAPGRRPDRTALREEGFGDTDAVAVLESFTRHFLTWIDRWMEEGFEPVRRVWERRLVPAEKEVRS